MALWIVATPIGTLEDLSPRARSVLESVALIAAEDTRVTRKLFAGLGLTYQRLVSVRAKNERQQLTSIIDQAEVEDVAYVCDAGTPCVSDPGSHLVEAALERGVRVLSVPGPSALPTALAVSGFQAIPSYFAGFAPKKGRENWLLDLLKRPETLVVFESPSRIRDLVRRSSEIAPKRMAAVCRELSKRHEEVIRDQLVNLNTRLSEHTMLKGEFVLVYGPGEQTKSVGTSALKDDSPKELAKALARRWGLNRREAYQELTKLDERFRDQD